MWTPSRPSLFGLVVLLIFLLGALACNPGQPPDGGVRPAVRGRAEQPDPSAPALALPSGTTIPEAPPQPGPRILRPSADAEVDMSIEVTGDLVGEIPTGHRLTLVVRPLPDRDDQSWWVQEAPRRSGTQWVAQRVLVGQRGDSGKRYRFRICAVITETPYSVGQQLPRQPSGPASCLDVVRR